MLVVAMIRNVEGTMKHKHSKKCCYKIGYIAGGDQFIREVFRIAKEMKEKKRIKRIELNRKEVN